MLKKILPVFLLFSVVFSCKKETPFPNNGIYRGVFNEIRSSGDTVASGVVYLALFEESSGFNLVGDSLTSAPASHSGSYLIGSGNNIRFTNSNTILPIHDADHYLDTTYAYVFDEEIFKFWLVDDTTTYYYDLIRD